MDSVEGVLVWTHVIVCTTDGVQAFPNRGALTTVNFPIVANSTNCKLYAFEV